jgi:hypothetical protein
VRVSQKLKKMLDVMQNCEKSFKQDFKWLVKIKNKTGNAYK